MGLMRGLCVLPPSKHVNDFLHYTHRNIALAIATDLPVQCSRDTRTACLLILRMDRKEKHLRRRTLSLLGCLMGILLVLPVFGQDTGTAPAQPAATAAPDPQQGGSAPAPAPAPPTWSVGPIQFSGAIDAYYGVNFNHPATQLNDLYNFNDLTNQFNLSLIKLAMSHDPDPVGFRVDLGYGRTMDDIVASQPPGQSDFNKYVEQAYVSWKPKAAKGFEADFGKFVTSAGAEVIESYSNWNYSRSLAFVLALPYSTSVCALRCLLADMPVSGFRS